MILDQISYQAQYALSPPFSNFTFFILFTECNSSSSPNLKSEFAGTKYLSNLTMRKKVYWPCWVPWPPPYDFVNNSEQRNQNPLSCESKKNYTLALIFKFGQTHICRWWYGFWDLAFFLLNYVFLIISLLCLIFGFIFYFYPIGFLFFFFFFPLLDFSPFITLHIARTWIRPRRKYWNTRLALVNSSAILWNPHLNHALMNGKNDVSHLCPYRHKGYVTSYLLAVCLIPAVHKT